MGPELWELICEPCNENMMAGGYVLTEIWNTILPGKAKICNIANFLRGFRFRFLNF